jgi:hypothetical protein
MTLSQTARMGDCHFPKWIDFKTPLKVARLSTKNQAVSRQKEKGERKKRIESSEATQVPRGYHLLIPGSEWLQRSRTPLKQADPDAMMAAYVHTESSDDDADRIPTSTTGVAGAATGVSATGGGGGGSGGARAALSACLFCLGVQR